MGTMTKKKFVSTVADELDMHPETVRHVIQSFLDHMTKSLGEGERVEFRDFGVFEVVERKAKVGRNPKQADVPIVIPARLVVKFTPGKKMREVLESDGQKPKNP